MKIRVLIVDDEAPARTRLRQLLKQEDDFEIVDECANGRQAVAAIQKLRPDVVFLDVQMPRLNGFEVCQAVGAEALPIVVFVTAYDQFALKAFEVHALDYLLKPFDEERFQKALNRVRAQASRDSAPWCQEIAGMLAGLRSNVEPLKRLAFKSEGRVIFVRIEEIDWVEADGNYVRIHANAVQHLLRETLTWLESQLPPERFMRINRSSIVNLDSVKEIEPLFYGDYCVHLRTGTKLTLSRGYRERLDALLARRH